MRGASDLNAEEIVQDYLLLCNLKKVAQKYGRSVPTIRKILVEHGVEIRHRYTPEHRKQHQERQGRPELREQHRQLWAAQHERQHRESPIHTYIERLLHGALERAGLSFKTQVRVGDHIPDIQLLDFPVLIEADGQCHLLTAQQTRDRKKDEETAALGFITFRFTGKEIKADADACIAVVQRYLDAAVAEGRWPRPAPHEPIVQLGSRRGEHGPMWGRKMTPEQIEKSASKRRGRTLSPEMKERIRQTLTGRKLPPEVVEKVSKALKGRTLTPEHKAKIGAANRAYYATHRLIVTDEQRRKISEALKGRERSPEHAAKLAEARRGKKHSPETKALISAKVRAAVERRKARQSDEDIVRPHG